MRGHCVLSQNPNLNPNSCDNFVLLPLRYNLCIPVLQSPQEWNQETRKAPPHLHQRGLISLCFKFLTFERGEKGRGGGWVGAATGGTTEWPATGLCSVLGGEGFSARVMVGGGGCWRGREVVSSACCHWDDAPVADDNGNSCTDAGRKEKK